MKSPIMDDEDKGFEALDLNKANPTGELSSAETALQEPPEVEGYEINVTDAPAEPVKKPKAEPTVDSDSLAVIDDDLTPLEGEDAQDPEKKKAFGLKAKKRYGELTQKNKALEQELQAARQAAAKLEKEKEEFYRQKAKETKAFLLSRAEDLKKKLKAAKEAGNVDDEVDITDNMADTRARLLQLQAWEAANFKEEKKPEVEEEPAPKPQRKQVRTEEELEDSAPEQQPVEPSARMNQWMKNNPWFDMKLFAAVHDGKRELNTDDPKELKRFQMTSTAIAIHQRLMKEGYNPDDEFDDEFGQEAYLSKLNGQLKKAFPVTKPTPQTPPIAPKSKPSQQGNGKNTENVSMTAEEYAMARRLAGYSGVPIQNIAKEKAKLNKKGQF
jgi:hypothetical protein